MRGRKPVPTQLKLIRGNPGRRAIPTNEFKPSGLPRCPPHLEGEARKHWRKLTRELAPAGLASVDAGMLAMMCAAWADHVEAREMMKKARAAGGSGMFVKSPNNFPMQSPWMAVSNKSMELYSRLAVEFGMSPSSRTRVAGAPIAPNSPDAVPKSSGWKQFA